MGEYAIQEAQEGLGDAGSPGAGLRGLIRELFISGLPLNVHSNVLAADIVVKPRPGYLLGMTVNNTNAAAQYVLLFDAATLPADGAVPCTSFTVPASSHLAVYFNTPGRAFLTGIVACNSSTADSKTIGSADCFFDAQFI